MIEGLVQGVYFRDSCRHLAVRHGLTGWVRNRPDGAVEAVFEGPEDAVEAAVGWCHEGPSRAVVTAVAIHVEDPQGEVAFRVR